MQSKILTIKPSYAAKLLKKNPKNRVLSDSLVRRYAEAMRKEKWRFNGEAVIIANDQSLLDGQHRLAAIVRSDKAQKMVVVTGVDTDVFGTIDIGKKRSAGDALAAHSTKYRKVAYNTLAAAIVGIKEFDSNYVWRDMRGNRPTHEEVTKFADNNPKLLECLDYCQHLKTARTLFPVSGLTSLYFLTQKIDKAKSDEFFSKFDSGAQLDIDDPILALREKLNNVRLSGGIFRSREILPYFARTWSYLRTNTKTKTITVPSDYVIKLV